MRGYRITIIIRIDISCPEVFHHYRKFRSGREWHRCGECHCGIPCGVGGERLGARGPARVERTIGRVGIDGNFESRARIEGIQADRRELFTGGGGEDVCRPANIGAGIAYRNAIPQRIILVIMQVIGGGFRIVEDRVHIRHGGTGIIIGNIEISGIAPTGTPAIADDEGAIPRWPLSEGEICGGVVVIPSHHSHRMVIRHVRRIVSTIVTIVVGIRGRVEIRIFIIQANAHGAIAHHRLFNGGVIQRIGAGREPGDLLYVQRRWEG